MKSVNIYEKYESKFDNIKSDFILKKIFNIVRRKKSFQIMKYNKKLQKRLNISINEYKDYYLSIENELKIADNKFGKFINISNDEKEYYRIYFNNSKEEITKNYLEDKNKPNLIQIIINNKVKSFKKLFYKCNCINQIIFCKTFINTNITDMSEMFSGCTSLKEIDISNLDTNNAKLMNSMFYDCSSLKELYVSNFNTNNVINMNRLFSGCSSLKELNVSNFNTNNVTDMSYMFSGNLLLKELNLSNFNTKKVNKMSWMFAGCSLLIKLNISNFITNNVNDMAYMFYRCCSLKELNVSNFNTNNVTNMSQMFSGCSSLKELNLANFNMSKVNNYYLMLYGCSDELIKKIKKNNKNIIFSMMM